MKTTPKLILACFLLVIFIHPVLAQPICGFDIAHARQLKENAQYRKNVQATEAYIHSYIQQHPGLLQGHGRKVVTGGNPTSPVHTLSGPPYQIPVVVHVIHTGGIIGSAYNPTDAQILDAISYLNEVYNGSNSSLNAQNLGIQFVLAQRDPDCNPTNGINRVDGSGVSGYVAGGINQQTTLGTSEINIKNLSRWDNTQYYNIWIVNKIDGNDGTSGQFIAGYAYFPGAPSTLDGIVMLATQMVRGQKTFPHEMGHAFNLYHPFQGSTQAQPCPANTDCTSEGDDVCDTDPISENINWTTGAVDFTCRTGTNPCTGTAYSDNTEANYMNYTNCYHVFTAGQAARMQAAAVSSDRISLTTSLGGTPPSAGGCTPKIDFELSGDQQTETTSATSGCRSYKDYSYNMVIGAGPSAAATATLTVNSGTAKQGLDFDITTNGSFTSPSQQLTFPAGSTTSQPFTIRVYDDASVNGTRSATLGFSVNNGGGNAAAGDGRSTFTMIIDDNDSPPTVGVTPNSTISVGSLAYTASSAPFDATQLSQRSQILYKASELTAAGVPAGPISGLSLYVYTKNSTRPLTNLYIKLGTTPAATTYLDNGGSITLGNSMTVVKSLPSYSTQSGWNTFKFDNPYTWDGTSNLVVEVCYDNGTAAATDAADVIGLYSDGGSTTQGNIFWQDSLNCWDNFSSLSGVFAQGVKPVIQFSYGITPTVVQSTLNSSQSQYLGPNADVYFYDQTSGELMARIQNLTGFNYGCTQVVIDRAGTNATQFWNTNTPNYLMDKTFHVIPTTNNSSGSYNITLYYTAGEVSGWQTATGQSLANIQLVKVPGQISQVTAASPNGGGTVTTASPTIGTVGTNTSLTYNFTNGFSGFGAGVPGIDPLPIGLLYFNGRLDNGNALLTWSTSSEQNSKTFEIDRSWDGLNFTSIGNVPAAGNSTVTQNYSFTDPSLTRDTNYYRLKEIDLDDRYTYSKIVVVNTQLPPSFKILPNPFIDGVDLIFGQVPSGNAQIRLLDLTGRVLMRQTIFESSDSRVHLAISTSLSSGIYLLEVRSASGTETQRIIKK